MGVAIPQVVSATEDRASGAQIIDGSLRFDSGKNHSLKRIPTLDGSKTTWTWSGFVKRSDLPAAERYFWGAYYSNLSRYFLIGFNSSHQLYIFGGDYYTAGSTTTNLNVTTNAVFRDTSAFYHIVVAYDTTQAISTNRIKAYVNGVLQQLTISNTPAQNSITFVNSSDTTHYIGAYDGSYQNFNGQMSQVYLIDGQALDASYFGYTDPLTNVWRPKKYVNTTALPGDGAGRVGFGTNGFYLPFDGNSPIGQDRSGPTGIGWTPVNFGGSTSLEKATGALPILNTDGGGKVARVGVRTDANASSLVLALPLVGIKSDFSNAVNSGTSNKAITVTGDASASSAQSNFYGGSWYFDGSGDYLQASSSSDFAFGTGDFTIEWLQYWNSTSSIGTLYDNGYSSNPGCLIQSNVGGTYNIWVAGSSFTSSRAPVTGKWIHYAAVRSGTTVTFYQDGVADGSATLSGNAGTSASGPFIGGSTSGGGHYINGYIQDFRIYNGVAKYTSNFIPASTDPDIVPDSPSGVSYSSNVALVPSTDGAVAFDGSGDYLSLASSADFELGSGDFTVECFVNFNDVTSNSGYSAIVNRHSLSGGTGWGLWNQESKFGFWMNAATVQVNSGDTIKTGKWYHVAAVRSGSTVTLYVDGIAHASTTNSSFTDTSSQPLGIGVANVNGGWNAEYGVNGFISNAHIVKGTALYTSNFTPPTSPISSVANTKLLCCKSNSSATAYDVSPGTITANGNAAATNFNPFTVNINTQRGKSSGYATWNPLLNSVYLGLPTLSNGNLESSGSTGAASNIGVTSGKWYSEFLTITNYTVNWHYIGIMWDDLSSGSQLRVIRSTNGDWFNGSAYGSFGTGYTIGDIIGLALDVDAKTVSVYKNGILLGTKTESSMGSIVHFVCNPSGGRIAANFGQNPFKFPPPAGFQPLTLANTPRPTIVRPDQFVGVSTWTGNGTTRSIITGFKPDFVWIKDRSNGYNHVLFDSVRGTGGSKVLFSNRTTAEGGGTGEEGTVYGHVSSFDTYGFSVSPGSGTPLWVSDNGDNYVAWAWKAGGNSNTFNIDDVGYSTASAAGLTAGTITPTGASVNTKSGFSIIAYTGNGSSTSQTISHGLGKVPSFAIVKARGSATNSNWRTRHNSLASNENLLLNDTTGSFNAASIAAGGGVGTLNSSSTFTLVAGPGGGGFNPTDYVNQSGITYIAYLWAEIPGFSKFGSYTGNANSDGPVIITGFKPKLIIMKATGDIAGDVEQWIIRDSTRSPYNAANANLYANLGNAEDDASGYTGSIDILSNGFKMRGTYGGINESTTYIYAAWAESPTFNLYGAQSNAR